MTKLFLGDIKGDNLDAAYLNLLEAKYRTEIDLVARLEKLWAQFENYADSNFRCDFARSPYSKFWEMYLGCALLNAGKELLPTSKRAAKGGQPDICVLEGGKRIWIEAIAPREGDGAEGPISLPPNYEIEFHASPHRQIQLRISSALWTKTKKVNKYRKDGVIRDDEISLIAIGAPCFGVYAGTGGIPLALSTVFPIGDQYFTVDTNTYEIVGQGFHRSEKIKREGGDDIPRTAFLDVLFKQVGGLIWSRVTIGNMDRKQRPLTFIHNPVAEQPLHEHWGVWDHEYAATVEGKDWSVVKIL